MKLLASLIFSVAVFAQTAPAPAAAAKPADAAKPAREPGLYAVINTTMGVMVAKLYEKEVPMTVKNFSALARGLKQHNNAKGAKVSTPMFNGVTFHRVIPGFMIQTGDPTATGAHDCGFTIKDEFVPSLKFDSAGVLGMANAGPNTGSCQFFITVVPTPHLNGLHTIFGKLVEGDDVAKKISEVPTGAGNKPRTAIRITSVKMERSGPPPAGAAPAAKKKAGAAPAAKKKTAAPAAKK